MIVYGSNSKHLKTEQSKHTTCPNCETKGSLVFSVYRRHAHVFWIPLFPIGKVGASQCQNCQNVLEKGEMPKDIKAEYQAFSETAKGPIWQFSGLVLIAALVIWIKFSIDEDTKTEQQYISSPQIDDIYEYKIKEAFQQ